jgi:hypothetical protein
MKRKVDDRGGWPDDTLTGRSEHDPACGEQQADAMMRLLARPDGQPCDLPGAATGWSPPSSARGGDTPCPAIRAGLA